MVNSDTMGWMRWCWVICALWLWGSTLAAPAAAAVRVVATIFPVADMVRQIGGELVDVATLLPAGASPHTFEPTPDQVRTVAQATVFVEIGAGLDTWAGKLKAARSGPLTVVTLTVGLPLLGATPERGEPHGGDPHVWLDPVLVRDHLVPAIARGLSQADPSHQVEFQRGAAGFQTALTQLDADIRATLAPAVNRNYVAFHSAWRYFGQRYDLHEVAVVEGFPGKEASALEVAGVVDKARAAHVRVVLMEPQFNPRMAEQIAHEIGAQVLLVDPLGGPGLSDRSHYLELLRYNLQVFAKALL